MTRRLLATALLLFTSACDAPQVATPDAGTSVADTSADGVSDASVGADVDDMASPERAWEIVLEDLPGAVLSVWSSPSGELWVVGADSGDGPVVMRRDADGWSTLDPGVDGHLWWVWGPSDDEVWLVGAGGTMLRWERATGEFTPVETGTDVTLYGVWGAGDGVVWAVGGDVMGDGPGVLLRVADGEAAEVTDLPDGLSHTATFFKVWGAGPDDAWAVGEEGVVLRWDGATWSRVAVPGEPHFITVHGRDASDVVAVGGRSQAVIFEREGGGWVDRSPEGYVLLNGVFVAPDGRAVAAGVLGAVLERTPDGWTDLPEVPLLQDWHATRIDDAGNVWVVGGNLRSASALDQGAVLCYGTSCGEAGTSPEPEPGPEPGPEPPPELPPESGPEPPPEPGPEPPPEHVEVVEVVEVVEGAADVAEPAPDVVEPVEDIAEPAPDVAPEVLDVSPDIAEVGPDVPDDATSGLPITVGVRESDGSFTPLSTGASMEIVQGPQGGIHVEVAVRFSSEVVIESLAITGRILMDGEQVGSLPFQKQFPAEDEGVYLSGVIPVFFDEDDAEVYVGSPPEPTPATVCVDVTPDAGPPGTGCADVVLVDEVQPDPE